MRLLLDTHIAVWATTDPDRLSRVATDLILSPDNQVFSSHVSLWEVAVKRTRPRRSATGLPATPEDAAQQFLEAGFRSLPIRYRHICSVGALPEGHGDPFDRLLVAQALSEPMRLLTHDRQLAAYSDTVIVV